MVLVRARVCSFPLCHFHCVNVFGGRMVVRQLNSFCFWLLRGVLLHALLSVPSLCCLVCEIAQCSRQSRSSCGKALGDCCLLWNQVMCPPLAPVRCSHGGGRARDGL